MSRALALTLAMLAIGLSSFEAAAAVAPVAAHHARVRGLAQLALSLDAQGQGVPDSIAPSQETAGGRVYGMFVMGSVTAEQIRATGAAAGTVTAVGATAHGTLRQLRALALLPGVTDVELAGRARPELDQSVPATHAAEPGHAGTAGVPHLWSGSLPGPPAPTFATWSQYYGCSGGGGKTPVVAGAFDYIRDGADGNHILNTSNGVDTGRTFAAAATTAPAVDTAYGSGEGRIFTVTGGTLSAAKVSDGTAVWSFTPASDSVVTAPVIAGSTVFVGGASGNVYAIPEAGNGSPTAAVWTGAAGAAISATDEQNVVVRSGLSAGQGILTVAAGNRLVAFGPATPVDNGDTSTAYQVDAGHDGWQPSDGLVTAGLSTTPKWSTGDLGATVSYAVLAGGRAFFTTNDGKLHALSQADGSTAWGPVDLGAGSGFSALTYDGGRLFVVRDAGQHSFMEAYDPATGNLLWKTFLTGQYLFTAPPTARAGVVYTSGSGSGGNLYAVSEADGHIVSEGLVSNGDQSSPAVTADGVYVTYACDYSYRFPVADGATTAFSGNTGRGSVVGIVDGGIDIHNPDFQTVGNATRIRYLWDQAACATTVQPSACNPNTGYTGNPVGYTYGEECTGGAIDGGTCGSFQYYYNPATGFGTCDTPVSTSYPARVRTLPEEDCDGHGTHVAGIAAGNGRNNGNRLEPVGRYIGMAPEADIVFVKTTYDFAAIVDGVSYVFSRATALGEPAVVNLSLGTSIGPHDGTSMQELLLDQLTGPAHPGHLIVGSAGNNDTRGDGQAHVYEHASGIVPQGGVVTNNLWVQDQSGGPYLDIWYPAGSTISVQVNGPGLHTGFVGPDRSQSYLGEDGTCDNANNAPSGVTASASNGSGDRVWIISCSGIPGQIDSEIQMFLYNPNSSNDSLSGCTYNTPCIDTWNFQLRGDSVNNGFFNAWDFDQGGYWIHNGGPGSSNLGNDAHTVHAPATAHNVISAGSYVERTSWTGLDGNVHVDGWVGDGASQGDLSIFSSVGPTRDGRRGVDVVAPGEEIGSSLSANASSAELGSCGYSSAGCVSRDGAHLFLDGTSMAAPHVTGALALLLALDRTMTTDQARRALGDAAANDSYTARCPGVAQSADRCWGAGKLQVGPGVTSVTGARGPINAPPLTTICGVDFQDGMHVSYALPGQGFGASITPAITHNPATTGDCFSGTLPHVTTAGAVAFRFVNPDQSTGLDPEVFTYDALPGVFTPITPERILETRTPSQTGNCLNMSGSPITCGALGPNSSMEVQLTGKGSPTVIPSNATAIVLNATVTGPTAGFSYLTAWPNGISRPTASNLNYYQGQTVANLVTVPIGTGGRIDVYNESGSVYLILDVAGYYVPFSSGDAGRYQATNPIRFLDTRGGTGTCYATGTNTQVSCAGALGPGQRRDVQFASLNGLPALHGGSAVMVNLTVTNPSGPQSYLTAYPSGAAMPTASNLNYHGGQTLANRAALSLGANGRLTLYNYAGSVDVIIDLGGWFGDGSEAVANGLFVPVTPHRDYDSRDSFPLGAGNNYTTDVLGTRAVTIGGLAGVPAGASAAVLNVTVVDTSGPWSYLTVYPGAAADPPTPHTSDLNWSGFAVVPNLVVVKLGGGRASLYNNAGMTNAIVDVEGYYT